MSGIEIMFADINTIENLKVLKLGSQFLEEVLG